MTVNQQAADAMIADIDRRVAWQLDELLHHPCFQRLERLWRAVWFVVSSGSHESVVIELLQCSQAELPSGGGALRRALEQCGNEGKAPVAVVIGDYEFDAAEDDLRVLHHCAEVAASVHAPFVAAVSPGAGDQADWNEQVVAGIENKLRDAEDPFVRFRREHDSQYVALLCPRFRLRDGHHADVGGVDYVEGATSRAAECWGNPAFALASRIGASFAECGWGPNIIGRDGVLTFDEAHDDRVEIAFGEESAWRLNTAGFGTLIDADAPFFSDVPSLRQPKFFGDTPEGRAADFNYWLDGRLPYKLMACRFAHYVTLLHRQWAELDTDELTRLTNQWLSQFVHDAEVVTPQSWSRRPLLRARFRIDGARWVMTLRPRFPYREPMPPGAPEMGHFSISVGGELRRSSASV